MVKRKTKITQKWLREQIRDETKSAKMYRKMGFRQIAEDEKSHAKILKGALRAVKQLNMMISEMHKVKKVM